MLTFAMIANVGPIACVAAVRIRKYVSLINHQ